jgi:hypothetical protein
MVMNIAEMASGYEKLSDDELTQIVVANYDLSQKLIASHPEMAQDAGFELFDPSWAKRYWRTVVGEITGIKSLEDIYSWAISTSIVSIADLLVAHYQIPPAALSASVALAIILVRAARAALTSKDKPNE